MGKVVRSSQNSIYLLCFSLSSSSWLDRTWQEQSMCFCELYSKCLSLYRNGHTCLNSLQMAHHLKNAWPFVSHRFQLPLLLVDVVQPIYPRVGCTALLRPTASWSNQSTRWQFVRHG